MQEKVAKFFLELDLKDVIKFDNKGEEEGKEEEEYMEVGVELVGTKEVAPEEIIEAKTIDNVVAEVVVDAETMASEAAENLEAIQVDVLDK